MKYTLYAYNSSRKLIGIETGCSLSHAKIRAHAIKNVYSILILDEKGRRWNYKYNFILKKILRVKNEETVT